MMMDPIILISGGAMISVLIIGGVFWALVPGARQHLEKRATSVVRVECSQPETEGKTGIKRETLSRLPGLEKALSQIMPKRDELQRRLTSTGRPITITGYAIGSIITLIASFLMLHIIGGMPLISSLLFGMTLCIGGPHYVVNRMIKKRRDAFEVKFPDGIDLMVRGLRSGLPVSETVAAVGQEMQGPVGEEFRRISESVKMGSTLENALWEAVDRLSTAEFKFFVISLSVQQQTGGNLSETLANLSEILRQRRQMRLKIKAMSSEARASAMILGSLPFVMFIIIYLMNPEYESMLFTDERGKIMLGFACGIMGMGILVMRKMIRFEI